MMRFKDKYQRPLTDREKEIIEKVGFVIFLLFFYYYFFLIRPSPGLLPVLGPLEQFMTPTLDAALLISSRAGTDILSK